MKKNNIEDIKNILKQVRYLKESIATDSGRYIIREYDPINSQEDKQYLSEHSKEIWEFMEEGYQTALNDKFVGCHDVKSVKRNTNYFKIAFSENGEYIAISLYSGYLFGKKCVGITATTNENLRQLGKQAVNNIIKQDASKPLEFFWCECSDKVEYLFEKYGGIKIHSEFVKYYIDKSIKLKTWLNDDYHYTRVLNNGKEVTKVIFGFNKKETFDIVYQKYKDEIDKKLSEIDREIEYDKQHLKEGVENYDYDLEFAEYLVGDFWIYVNELGMNEYPQEFLDLARKSLNVIQMRGTDNEDTRRHINCFNELLNYVTPLECHHYVGTQAYEEPISTTMVAENKKIIKKKKVVPDTNLGS